MENNHRLTEAKERLTERALLVTALATLAGYLVLAWAVLRREPSARPRGK